jgi:hypothetical protein
MAVEKLPTTLRAFAVADGRAMVRVRSLETRAPATIGVCPACFNLHSRRDVLLMTLAKHGYEVVHRSDRLDGEYRPGKKHAPGCRWTHLPTDPWKALAKALKRNREREG